MLNRSDVTYIYDGSFDGLMSCVFESFRMKEIPDRIIMPNDMQYSMFDCKYIETEEEKSRRVKKGINSNLGKSFIRFIERAYLTCLEEKEKNIVMLTHIGFKYGKRSLKMIDNPVVNKVHKAVGYLSKESHLLKEFLRFSIHKDAMIAQITPNNFVLPFLAPHFVERFPDENFMIYDNKHGAAFVYDGTYSKIIDIEEFSLPAPADEEVKFRRLWKMFYHTIGIKSRKNDKCRMTHMPKRYWCNLTEFMSDREFDSKFDFEEDVLLTTNSNNDKGEKNGF